MHRDAITWFEIPALDIERATTFYQNLLGTTLRDTVLARVASLGGKLLTPKTALPPGMGFFAHIEDSEGNRVGLHALA